MTTIVVLWPNTGLSKRGEPVFPHCWHFWEPSFLRFQSNRGCGSLLCAGCRKGQYGCQSVGVIVIPCALVFWGVCWPAGQPFVVMNNSLFTAVHSSALHCMHSGSCFPLYLVESCCTIRAPHKFVLRSGILYTKVVPRARTGHAPGKQSPKITVRFHNCSENHLVASLPRRRLLAHCLVSYPRM